MSESLTPSPALARVAKGGLCAGCGLCAAIAPDQVTIEVTEAGFLRPTQTGPIGAAQDAAIAASCPGLGQTVDAGGRTDDTLWGPYTAMQTGWASDPDLRHAASSGGALSAVLVHLIEGGEVDAVLQTTADPQTPWANTTQLSRSADQILTAAGSRYAPLAPLAGIEALLTKEERIAFVGKPCDVVALRARAMDDPRVARVFPVMVSFFCAGVPSLTGAREVIKALGVSPDEVTAFRYRGNGWPGRAAATLTDGSDRSMTYHESWGGILSGHVQHRCKICADGTGKAADIVCADAWETDAAGYPLFEERDGVSLIVARTALGARLIDQAAAAGAIATEPFDVAGLASMQPGQSGRRRVLAARLAGLLVMGKPIPRYRGLHVIGAAKQGRFPTLVRNFLGMVRRVLQGRIR
ncbi:MAG: Coenzyme F420 hydrogenase/dehydrogenase, beta subunit C-terminal domain [Alphaproteobacteria bacterium]|nr:Coenzyme F420 hydrogenase/dehydrogenase, beta subunit C-terminal domain [Alphaproteobacteria bacterium]